MSETKMTVKSAEQIIGTNYPSSYWDGKSPQVVYATQCNAKGFLDAVSRFRPIVKALQLYLDEDDGMYATAHAKKALELWQEIQGTPGGKGKVE